MALPKITSNRKIVKKLLKAYIRLTQARYELNQCTINGFIPYSSKRGNCASGISVGKTLISDRINYLLRDDDSGYLSKIHKKMRIIDEKYQTNNN